MKVLTAILLSLLLFTSSAFGATATFTWTQTLPSPNTITAWGIYQSSVSGSGYVKIGDDVPYVSELASYTSVKTITADQNTTYYFVIDAVYTGGARTGYSSELSGIDNTPAGTPSGIGIIYD